MKVRLASKIQYDSIVDGPGIRAVLWTQGCLHKCLGCHNPETHDCNGGFSTDIELIKRELEQAKYQDGLTLSGGDPFLQPEACYEIAKFVKNLGWDVWCYTGYTFEELLSLAKTNNVILDLLNNIDVLIDGKFILSERSLSLKFRGSLNQRIIDVKNSLKKDRVILIDKYMKNNVLEHQQKEVNFIYV